MVLIRVKAALENPDTGIAVLPIGHEIALEMEKIPRETVPEMCDRIIAATALYLGLPLITKDSKIRKLSIIQTVWDNSDSDT